MMLLELCWPKELKQTIAECREKGVLNEEVLAYLQRTTRRLFIIWFILALIPGLTGYPLVGILIVCFSPLFIRADFYFLYKNSLATYVYGRTITAAVKNVAVGMYGTQTVMVYSEEEKKYYTVTLGRSPVSPTKKLPKVGEMVKVNIDDTGKYRPTLELPHLKKYLSLKKY